VAGLLGVRASIITIGPIFFLRCIWGVRGPTCSTPDQTSKQVAVTVLDPATTTLSVVCKNRLDLIQCIEGGLTKCIGANFVAPLDLGGSLLGW